MKKIETIRTLLLLPIFTVFSVCGYAQAFKPGENPIFRNIFTADPAPLVVDDTLYVYVGHDEAGEGQMFNITEWVVYSTTDMKNWTFHDSVMKPTDFDWAVRDAWASQVIEKDGKFWFYTTVEHGPPHNAKAIGVAVADSPLGPFRDAKGSALVYDGMTPTPEDPHDWDDIDPTVFTDDDGTTWVAWGNMHLYLAKLKANMIEFDGPIQEIYLPNYTEGPWLHKREDVYYLTYPCFAHQNMYEKMCYATAPRITGEWTYQGILTDRTENSFTIHPGIVEYKDQWYFFYHDAKLSIDGVSGAMGRRSVAVQYLYYNEDGTIKPITQTKDGVSFPPKSPESYQGPVFNPAGPLVAITSDIQVTQDIAIAATEWKGTPVLQTTGDPYQTAIIPESFNRSDQGAATLGQVFRPDVDFRLREVSLYVGDGLGTTESEGVTLALYEFDEDVANRDDRYSYVVGNNLLGPDHDLKINYTPQAQGLLQLRLDESRQPVLHAGRSYVLELQGVRGSAPLFWRRTKTDTYPGGAAYQDRSLIENDPNAGDFGLALYGDTLVGR
ncbi:glycoside hydrolase family 43 protein [Microbulbifer celer]|uniref:Glycoside hydrolase family 43 protein n=1 Tax=Microbulbifer celer TaxID=435905 RepID=A0ABW3UD37_9GAMM|nr:glycoside hydrolase family 43 protein [Microbulbifer celer]UFN57514.1 glycoside hydrolase family 43 protein [Microbulbifer celer]